MLTKGSRTGNDLLVKADSVPTGTAVLPQAKMLRPFNFNKVFHDD
jgi:hypothetical protein